MNVSVVGELVARVRHTHAKYNHENAIVYKHLEEATRSTALESSVRQFKRSKNGRGAWFAIVDAHAGVENWEADISRSKTFIRTTKWKVNNNTTLKYHM